MTSNMSELVSSEIDRYAGLYKEGKTGWQLPGVNPVLLSHVHTFPKNVAGSRKTICVPLCGKSRDVPYLLSLGYRVFAIEAVQEAIHNLAKDNNLTLEYDARESLYTSPDGGLQIYCGNIFDCPIEKYSPFHGVWDRGSLSVFPEPLRPRYVNLVTSGLDRNEFTYLLSVYDYDNTLSIIPPRAVSHQEVIDLFGPRSKVTLLSSSPPTSKFLEHHTHLQDVPCSQVNYRITSANPPNHN